MRLRLRRLASDARAAAARRVRSAPGTHVYLLVLLVTTGMVRSLHPVLATQLLREVSTNLAEMGRSAGRVLFLSAFLLDTGGRWLPQAVLFTLVFAPVERWAGTARWLAVVAVGHVGATLVTTVGIWADVRSNRAGIQLVHSIDVGVSYGLAAVAAFGTYALGDPRVRLAARAVLVGTFGVALVVGHSFTDAGHAAALCLGFAMHAVVGDGLTPRPAPPWWRWMRWRGSPSAPGAASGTAPSP